MFVELSSLCLPPRPRAQSKRSNLVNLPAVADLNICHYGSVIFIYLCIDSGEASATLWLKEMEEASALHCNIHYYCGCYNIQLDWRHLSLDMDKSGICVSQFHFSPHFATKLLASLQLIQHIADKQTSSNNEESMGRDICTIHISKGGGETAFPMKELDRNAKFPLLNTTVCNNMNFF